MFCLCTSKLLTIIPKVLLGLKTQNQFQTTHREAPQILLIQNSKDMPQYVSFAKTISQRKGLPSTTDLTNWLP